MFEKEQPQNTVYYDSAMDLIDEIQAFDCEKDIEFVEGCIAHLKDHRSISGLQWNTLLDIYQSRQEGYLLKQE